MNSINISKITERLQQLKPDISDEDFFSFKRRAAVSLVLRVGETDPEILFIHRSQRVGDPWSGHIAFPGGGTEPQDASAYETAKRETLEEVGLDLSNALYLGRLARLQLLKLGSPIDFGLECHLFVLEGEAKLTLQPREVSEAFWAKQSELFHQSRVTERDFHFSGISKKLPCIEINGKIIWGITYMLLSHYVSVVNELEGLKLTPLPPYPLRAKR